MTSARISDFSVPGDEKVTLTIDGTTVHVAESYEIKLAVLTQPAAFTLRLGWSDTAAQLLKLCNKGALFELRISDVLMQSGIIDGRGVPSSDSTVVEVKGRDYMRQLINSHVEQDIEFKDKTYFELTRKVMDLCGLKSHELVAGNGANRRALTSSHLATVKDEEQVRVIETGIPSPGGYKMEYKSLKAKVGQRWYDWLQDRYKLAGLFLWCAGDGKFVLASPQPNVEPIYMFVRQRGADRNTVNVITHSFRDDATNRHAKYVVYGRFGHGKYGRNKIRGEFIDQEMVDAGFTDVITYHDPDVATTSQAEHLAKRYAAEERRAGWDLSYTVMGHRTPAIDGSVAIWAPDTTADVQDDELEIYGAHYLESITYSMNPQKTTRVELVRPSDLLYLAEVSPTSKKEAKSGLASAQSKQTTTQKSQGNPG